MYCLLCSPTLLLYFAMPNIACGNCDRFFCFLIIINFKSALFIENRNIINVFCFCQMSPRVRILSSGRYLQINNAVLGDGAQYTCVASNVVGETRRHFNLSVNGDQQFICPGKYCGPAYVWAFLYDFIIYFSAVPPTIKDGSQSVSVHINQPVVLECVVNGVPAPRITWRKQGSILAGNNPRSAAQITWKQFTSLSFVYGL